MLLASIPEVPILQIVINTLLLFTGLLLVTVLNNVTDLVSTVGQVMAGINNSKGDTEVRMEGSGVVVSPEGILATNYHVISDGNRPYSSIYVNLVDPDYSYSPLDRSRLFRTEIVLQDPANDLVLLRIVADADGHPIGSNRVFKAIPLGESRSLSFMDEIYAVGFPKAGGSTVTMTRGQISGKEEMEDWIKIDAQVTHGSSGGAVVNHEGKLIGIPTKVRPDVQMVDTDNDGFPDTNVTLGSVGLVRPVELVARMLDQYRSGKLGTLAPLPVPERLEVKGEVVGGKEGPVRRALVGLLKAGSQQATLENLLTWTRADDQGTFQFPVIVPPGKYTLRVRSEGFEVFLQEFEITAENHHLLVKLKPVESPEALPVGKTAKD